MSAVQPGSADMVELTVAVDKTCRPFFQARRIDPRELGVRVFHAFVQAK